MDEEFDISEVEMHANFQAIARLDVDQYTVLVTCMNQWVEEHPGETEAIQTLKSIEFVRKR